MFVSRYQDGRAVSLPVAAFDAVFRPYVAGFEPEYHCWNICAEDGSEGDLYADVTPEAVDDLWVTHAGDGVIELLIEFAKQADGVVSSSFGPALLTAEDQRRHLPAADQADAVVIGSSAEMTQALDDWVLAHPDELTKK